MLCRASLQRGQTNEGAPIISSQRVPWQTRVEIHSRAFLVSAFASVMGTVASNSCNRSVKKTLRLRTKIAVKPTARTDFPPAELEPNTANTNANELSRCNRHPLARLCRCAPKALGKIDEHPHPGNHGATLRRCRSSCRREPGPCDREPQ